MSLVDRICVALLVVSVVTSAFLDLELVWGTINVPVADLAALLAAVIFGVSRLGGTPLFGSLRLGRGNGKPVFALPGAPFYLLFLFVGLVDLLWIAATAKVWGLGIQFWLRKMVFMWLVYGGAMAAISMKLRDRDVHRLALVTVAAMSIPCLAAGLPMVIQGYAGSWAPVPRLTNNHKVLAVAVVVWLPLLWTGRARNPAISWVVGILGAAAVVFSFSRTAWVVGAFAMAWLFPVARRGSALRPTVLTIGFLLGVGLMAVFPILSGSEIMQDALDARMSINLRTWHMVQLEPILGNGPGAHLAWILPEAPHYRINGVEAHGVVQKVVGETGLVGLVAWVGFAWSILVGLWRQTHDEEAGQGTLDPGVAVMGFALFATLLLSTEAFTSSFWAPLAVVLGRARLASQME